MIFLTEYADLKTGKTYAGKRIEAESWQEAEFLAYPNEVVGVLQEEIIVSDN